MNRKTLTLGATVLAVTAGAGLLGWRLGLRQASGMAAPAPVAAATAAAPADPSQWSIPQGEEATRRHIRDGLKAGEQVMVDGFQKLQMMPPWRALSRLNSRRVTMPRMLSISIENSDMKTDRPVMNTIFMECWGIDL